MCYILEYEIGFSSWTLKLEQFEIYKSSCCVMILICNLSTY
jgi:hypothetical protein